MTETKDTLALRRLRIITDGIDSTEIAREEGWWATDKGATFGRQKLAELENMVMCLEAERDAAQEVAAMNARSGASWAARVQELESQLEAIGAGGVEPLRRRECLHQISEPGAAAQPPRHVFVTASIGTTQRAFEEGWNACVDAAPAIQAAPAAVAGPSDAVAYIDIGAGGYLDLGSDLSDEALRKLPKGRHMLAIVGTYGVDGYAPVAAPTTQPEQVAQGDALTIAEADQLEKVITDFDECGETDVPDTALQRFAAMGYLECVHYNVLPAAQEAIDAARSQAKEGWQPIQAGEETMTTEPTDAELDEVLCGQWPAFSMQATLVRMWVRQAMRAAVARWGQPSGAGEPVASVHRDTLAPLYAAPPTAQAEGWISMDERLPAANVTVLLTIDGKHITTGEYIRSLSCFSWNTHDDETDDSRVTHWMPLPPPPTSADGVEHG